jgi:hypothetical protein
VLDDFKSYPGSTVSINYIVPEEFADKKKKKFDHTEFFGTKLERFECGQNKIPGSKRGNQLQKLLLECEGLREVQARYVNKEEQDH